MNPSDAHWHWLALLASLGLVFGSFIATLVLRWTEGRSVAKGRSACDHCGEVLRAAQLVPILSYVVQRGRCRRCGRAIAALHPVVELASLGIGVAAWLAAPGWTGLAGAIFGWQLLALAALDLRAFWLPNRLTIALATSGLVVASLVPDFPSLAERLAGGAIGFAALWLVAFAYQKYRGRQGLGGGDPKIFGAIGCWLGVAALPMVLLGASLTGLLIVLALRLFGHRMRGTDRLPLGTLLAPAAFAVWLIMV